MSSLIINPKYIYIPIGFEYVTFKSKIDDIFQLEIIKAVYEEYYEPDVCFLGNDNFFYTSALRQNDSVSQIKVLDLLHSHKLESFKDDLIEYVRMIEFQV
jgi:hypothetical protein